MNLYLSLTIRDWNDIGKLVYSKDITQDELDAIEQMLEGKK